MFKGFGKKPDNSFKKETKSKMEKLNFIYLEAVDLSEKTPLTDIKNRQANENFAKEMETKAKNEGYELFLYPLREFVKDCINLEFEKFKYYLQKQYDIYKADILPNHTNEGKSITREFLSKEYLDYQ